MSPHTEKTCLSYRPGHHVHWIHARKSWTESGPTCGVALGANSIDDDGWVTFTIRTDGDRVAVRGWTHDPQRLRSLGRAGTWQPRWNLLRFGSTPIYLATDEPSPCGYR